jgi:hypothetical protein
MTVGEFRKLTSDLPADFRVTFAISPDIVPSWIKSFVVNVERIEGAHVMVKTGEVQARPRVVITIEPEETREESWYTPGGEI